MWPCSYGPALMTLLAVGSIGLHLEGCQVTTWTGGRCDENDQHLLITAHRGTPSTDTRMYGVFFSDAKFGPGIYAYRAPGTSFRSCTIDITRDGPLVELHSTWDSSFMDCRFEKAGLSRPGVHPALRLPGECRNIRLLGCYFSNTTEYQGRRPALIDAQDCSGLSLLANSFPAGSPVFGSNADYRALLNVHLDDH